MPCDTITTQSINLAKAMPKLVEESLKIQGWQITINNVRTITARRYYNTLTWTQNKGIEIRSGNAQQDIINLTKEYSKQAITWAASRAGWKVSSKGQNQLTVSRR